MADTYEESIVSLLGGTQAADELKALLPILDAVHEKQMSVIATAKTLGSGMGIKSVVNDQGHLVAMQNEVKASMATYKQVLAEAEPLIKRLNGTTKEHVTVTREMIKGLIEEDRLKRSQIQTNAAVERQAAASARAANKLSNEYEILRSKQKALADEALRLGAAFGTSDKRFIDTAAAAKKMHDQLFALERTVGRSQRGVGEYERGFSSLGHSIRVIASELPNAGISIRTFAQSLSNNINPLIDALRQAREQNALLVAEGKPAVSIGKQIASSIFSWQTAILAVVAAGTYLITNMKKQESASEKAEKINKKYAESLNSIEESARSSTQAEIAHTNVLVKIAADATQSMNNRLKAVKELQDSYPARFGNLTKEAILEGKVAEALRLTTQELLNKAAAQAAEKKFAAAGETVYDLELQQRKAEEDLEKARKAVLQGPNSYMTTATDVRRKREYNEARKAYDDITKQIEKARAEQKGYLTDAQRFAKEAGDTILGKAPETKKIKDTTAKDARDRQRALDEETKLTLTKLRARFEERSAINHDAFLDDKRSQQERLKAFEKYALDEISIVKLAGSIQGDTTEEIQAKVTELVLKFARERTEFLKSESDKQTKFEKENLKGLVDFASSGMVSKSGDNVKRTKKEQKELLDSINAYADAAIASQQALDEFVNAASQRRINAIQDEIDAIREKADIEIEAIRTSAAFATLTEQEKNDKINSIRAAANENEKRREREMISEKRQAAQREKAINIAEIIIKTALAVVNQLGGGDPYSAIPRAIAVGVMGAAQLAAAITAQIPQYAEGTDDSGEAGLRIVGDGRRKEVIRTADGKTYLTPDTPTLVNMPAHSTVYPDVQSYIDKAQYLTLRNLGATMKPVSELPKISTRETERLLNRVVNRLDRIANKEVPVNQSDFDAFYFLRVKKFGA